MNDKRCKHSDWKIIDDRETQDYVCVRNGSWITGHHLCYSDENCRHYEPIKEQDNDKIHDLYTTTN